MKTPLALLNLLHDKKRSSVAIAGVAFAVVLVLMQLGFYGSVEQTATNIYEAMEFDLVVVSHDYRNMVRTGTMSRTRIQEARRVPGVKRVVPFLIGFSLWRNPLELNGQPNPSPLAGRRRGIMVLGVQPHAPAFRPDSPITALLPRLEQQGKVLFDTTSRPEFGPRRVGTITELGDTSVEIVGRFALGTGFAADGTVLAGEETYCRLFGSQFEQQASLGLVQLDDSPGTAESRADRRRAAQQVLQAVLPQDVRVLTREEMLAHETDFWVNHTSVGKIFDLGVWIALIVGVAIVYQVLASDVGSRLAEFATLKAMGYTSWYLSSVVLKQAITFAVVGYVPGLAISILLYGWTRAQGIPIEMPAARAAWVLGMSMLMCGCSGLAALRKVHRADPAELFV